MTLKKAIKILNQHNEWKKDNSIPKKIKMVNPIELGLVYDFMLTMEKHCDNRCDMHELDDDINIEINYKVIMKKRYIAFLGNIYYPSGGMHDLLGSYDNLEDAERAVHCEVRDGYCSSFHGDLDAYLEHEWRARKWGHIYDTETNKIVWEK